MFAARKKTEKGCSKIDVKNEVKFGSVKKWSKYQNQSPLGHQRDDFGAGGEVRRGQALPGPAIPALIQLFSLKRPAPGGVRRMFFDPKTSLGREGFD